MLKISKNAGSLLKPHIPVLVTALLEAVSGLEPQVLNYFSLRVADSQATQDRVGDFIRTCMNNIVCTFLVITKDFILLSQC